MIKIIGGFCGVIMLSLLWIDGLTLIHAQKSQAISSEDLRILTPNEASWTDRFIFSELQNLRSNQDKLKQEIYADIQERELATVDRALSYSANTLNFFFIFLSIVIMGIGILGWRTIADLKKTLRTNMEHEIDKILHTFQSKLDKMSLDQKLNILWRNFSFTEISQEKLDILHQIQELSPDSKQVMTETSNVYLEMGLWEQVIEICNDILLDDSSATQALLNRGIALAKNGENDKAVADLQHLVKIAPNYKEVIVEKEALKKIAHKI